MEELAYIYALCCPDYGDFRYIGQAARPVTRLRNHMSQARTQRKTRKDAWLAELDDQSRLPILYILDYAPSSVIGRKETYWIKKVLGGGYDLLNIANHVNSGLYPRPAGNIEERLISLKEIGDATSLSLDVLLNYFVQFERHCYSQVGTEDIWTISEGGQISFLP